MHSSSTHCLRQKSSAFDLRTHLSRKVQRFGDQLWKYLVEGVEVHVKFFETLYKHMCTSQDVRLSGPSASWTSPMSFVFEPAENPTPAGWSWKAFSEMGKHESSVMVLSHNV